MEQPSILTDVYNLPFDNDTSDAITLIAVIGEIPQPHRALAEYRRVLKPDVPLAISETGLQTADDLSP